MRHLTLVVFAGFACVFGLGEEGVGGNATDSVVPPPALNVTALAEKLPGKGNATKVEKKKGQDFAMKLRKELERKEREKVEVKEEKKLEEKKKKERDSATPNVVPPPARRELEEEDEDEEKANQKSNYKSMTTEVISLGTTYSVRSVQAEMPKDTHNGDVLLLHGNSFTHSIWKDIETMDALREAGYRPTSVDLPGKGLSYPTAPTAVRGQWLADYITSMKIKSPIVVAPSMSGTYALPLLFNQPDMMKGLVTIAPSGALKISDETWRNVSIPVSIMFGAKDALAYVTAASMFRNIPFASRWKVGNGTHAFYVSRGPEFNKRLLRFIKKVHSSYYINKAAEKKAVGEK